MEYRLLIVLQSPRQTSEISDFASINLRFTLITSVLVALNSLPLMPITEICSQ